MARVIAHLSELADNVAAAAGDLEGIRRLIDQYSNADRSITECPAAYRPIGVQHIPCEWLLASESNRRSRLMYVHGGSWLSGSLAGYRAHAGRIAKVTGCSVLNVGYRLAPEDPYPAGLDDCDKVLDWMMENGPEGVEAAASTFVAGDSAGGNLILALLVRRRDQGKPLPTAAIALSPATDLAWSSPSISERADQDPVIRPERLSSVVDVYLQGRTLATHPYVSPLYASLAGLPPLLLQVGEAEVLLDDSVRFADKARRAGVPVRLDTWPGMPHVFEMFAPYLPQAARALNAIGDFLSEHRRMEG